MKRIIVFLLLTIVSHLSLYARFQGNYDPLLVVVLMVKNEETVIVDTLQPFVDGGVDSFFIFDTGSTDCTVAVTEQFFKDNGIERVYIEQEPFVNFAVSRNRALERAHECFPDAAFMLMPDAEWYTHNVEGLLDFCSSCLEKGEIYPSYLVRILNIPYLDFYTGRLIRCNCGVQFVGAVHEAIDKQTMQKVPADVFFEWRPGEKGCAKTDARFVRDRDLLLTELEKNPNHTRTLFYLARTCADLGDLESAHEFYKRRVALVGWDEEDFMAHYYFAHVIERLSVRSKGYQWSDALEYYLKAYYMRPGRIEPLIAIADHYVRTDQMSLAFLFARRAAEIPYPDHDVLIVQKYQYDYYRYELLARCAWYINEFEIGEWAAKKAFEACPEYEHAQTNMQCYLQRKIRMLP